MIKRKFFLISVSMLLILSSLFGCTDPETIGKETLGTTEDTDTGMLTQTETEFNHYFESIANIPVSFTYGGVYYNGFAGFRKGETQSRIEGDKRILNIELTHPDNILSVRIEAAVYKKYDAYEWTVYFMNHSSEDSAVLANLSAADLAFSGNNPVVKGNMGDYGGHFAPFEKDISRTSAVFNADTGRSSEQYLPYFNLETDEGGVMMAVGWSGTWQAAFDYDGEKTNITATGTTGLKTYLKPGEQVRTALMAFVRYHERDEDLATNKWRRWMIDCNMPYESAEKTEKVQPATIIGFVSDTPYGWYRGGSEDENKDTWRQSYEAVRSHNLKFDYHWFDAGWYYSPSGQSLDRSWFSTGSWTIDATKWGTDDLKEYNAAMKRDLTEKGTVMWFEVERLNGAVLDIVKTFGAKSEWYIPESGQNYLLWLGNEEAQDWVFNKVTAALSEAGADIYREDHNFPPIAAFKAGDVLQGENREGITENLHFQGKYKLWERIIEWQTETGRPTFIEMQSAGGNRQDLALLRYAVSFYRSDSDITLDPPSTVSKINALNKWIPYGGVLFGRLADDASTNNRNKYQWRSTYSSCLCVPLQFQNLTDDTWELLAWGLEEYNRYKEYTYYDFYELTPWKPLYDRGQWVSRMYYDPETDKGVLETFNFPETGENKALIQLKGLNPDHWYTLTDPDGINGTRLIKGSDLLSGYEIRLNPGTSSLIWIDPVNV